MSPSVPYSVRVLLAATFLVTVAACDLVRHHARATRWKEYTFWCLCGACGSVLAILTDLVTSRLSKGYFIFGKGLPPTGASAFVWEVIAFASHAGLVAGTVVGGVLLVANNPKPGLPSLRYTTLATYVVFPLAAALLTAPLVAMCRSWDVQGLGADLRSFFSEADVEAFLRVQRIHVGLYIGALIGTAVAVIAIRRDRRSSNRGRLL